MKIRLQWTGFQAARTSHSLAAVLIALAFGVGVANAQAGATVKVWADAAASGGPSISSDNALAFGPGEANLFVVESDTVYSTTGPVGAIPGTLASLGGIPGSGNNEGAVYFEQGGTSVLFSGSESDHSVAGVSVTGSGAGVGLVSPGTSPTYKGLAGAAGGDTGELLEFNHVEGLALLNGTPRFNDANATPVFSTTAVAPGVTVNGNSFPIVNANWSGKTLLVVEENDLNLIAVMILNDGTLADASGGVALAASSVPPFSNTSCPDGVAVTPDSRFAYVNDECNDSDFYRFDLQHLDSTGGGSHIRLFSFTAQNWTSHPPLAVIGNVLYSVGEDPGGNSTSAVYAMRITPATGNLGSPQLLTVLDDGAGNQSGFSTARLAASGTCLYASDSSSELIFQVCLPVDAAPALDAFGLVAAALLLLAVGGVAFVRARRTSSLPA